MQQQHPVSRDLESGLTASTAQLKYTDQKNILNSVGKSGGLLSHQIHEQREGRIE